MVTALSLTCPACGGSFAFDADSQAPACPTCSSLLQIEGEGLLRKIVLQDSLDRDRALAVTRQWLGRGIKARGIVKKAEFAECYRVYVPFWKLTSRAIGWVFGTRTETESSGSSSSDSNRTTTRIVPMAVPVEGERTWETMACDGDCSGVVYPKRRDYDAGLYREGYVPSFALLETGEKAVSSGTASVTEKAIADSRVSDISFSRVQVVPRMLQLIYYPVWVVRYRYYGRGYFAAIDGMSEKVVAGQAPGDPLLQSLGLGIGMAVTGFAFGAGLSFLTRGYGELVGIGALTLLVSLAVAAGCYLYIRHGTKKSQGDLPGGYNLGRGELL